MTALKRSDLYSLENYSDKRDEFRGDVLTQKKARSQYLGDHVLLLFENRMTIQYQIQEMLRIEKIFEAEAIEEELDAYNPLIPDGDNWKATMMIQYAEVEERRQKLTELVDIENRVWVQVGDSERIFAIADEDLERADESKTSAVHFLRFQLSAEFIQKVKNGDGLNIGVDHPQYKAAVLPVDNDLQQALTADLD